MDKRELRSFIREQKRKMTEADMERRSKALTEQFLASEAYKNARCIYGYLPYNQEVRTWALLEQALKDGKRVAVPKVCGEEMRFLYLTDFSGIEQGYAGIPEPVADGPAAHETDALVLMPGLAFDREGGRVGYGGGFYDKFLAAEPDHPTVALCYDFQLVEKVPTDVFDRKADCVLWA